MVPPPLALYALEPFALVELAAFVAGRPGWSLLPRGDGHPVLVIPGLIQSDLSTLPLRTFLRHRGYAVAAANIGRNSGRSSLVDDVLLPALHALHARAGRRVSLVGWSMGGLLARDLARREPNRVRQVITLGSPFTGDAKATNAWRLYERLSGERAGDERLAARWRNAPPVPTTSIYSRLDGIVSWRCCIDEERGGDAPVQNVEVLSTHFGFGHHPAVLWVVADRLAQPEGRIEPFRWSRLPGRWNPKTTFHGDTPP
jgi:pimeloyl-ACP methyl ester carboxylesterase